MSTLSRLPPVALSIAGSDSGGGAGIQADLKTFQAFSVHGTTAITAITAQNTREVKAIHALPAKHVQQQIQAVFEDFPVKAVKTGMLANARITRQVAQAMRHQQPEWLVVDPVMVATRGARLLDDSAVHALKETLIPLADVLTPNLIEAEALLGHPLRSASDFDAAGAAFRALGACAVLIKGGHQHGKEVVDRWYDARGRLNIRHPRLPYEAHGSGCTLAAAITAALAKGFTPRAAVRRASRYLHKSFTRSYSLDQNTLAILRH